MLQGSAWGLAALRQQRERPCPSDGLQKAVAALLDRAERLCRTAGSHGVQELSATELDALRGQLLPLMRSLASCLQRMDTEATERIAGCAPGAPRPLPDLYCSVLQALRSLAQMPALGAALMSEPPAPRGGRMGTVHVTLEALLAQMLSSGVRSMAADAEELMEEHLWPVVCELLLAAPTAGTTALLQLAASKGTSLLVSTQLTEDSLSMQESANTLVGHALEMLAAQMPLMWRDLDAPALAAPLNDRVSALLLAHGGSAEWRRMWEPVRSGLQALLKAMVAAAGPQLYCQFKAALPPYAPSELRPPLLAAMNRYFSVKQSPELLEPQLTRILRTCGYKATERVGLHDLRKFAAEHGAWLSLFLSQTEGSSWGKMVSGFVAAAERTGACTAQAEGLGKAIVSRPLAQLSTNTAVVLARPAVARLALAACDPVAAEAAGAEVVDAPVGGALHSLLQPEPGVLRSPRGLLRTFAGKGGGGSGFASRLRLPTNLSRQ